MCLKAPSTLAALVLVGAACRVQAQLYAVTRLVDLPGATQSWALDVNAAGQVAGSYMHDGWKRANGFVWQNGAIVEHFIPRPGSTTAVPPQLWTPAHHVESAAINDAGAVAGLAALIGFGFFPAPYFASTPSPGKYPDLLAMPVMTRCMTTDLTSTYPMLCVGWGYVQQGTGVPRRAFAAVLTFEDGIGDPPRRHYIAGLNGPTSGATAQAANDDWTIDGGVETSGGSLMAYTRDWTTGALQLLGTLGGPASEAMDINAAGHIVGWAHAAPGRARAFLHEGSQMIDLGTLGGPASTARDINNSGQIVGEAWTAGTGANVHAFIHENGQMYDLNDMIPAGTGWTLQRAHAINDDGWIAGEGWIGGESHAFLLIPENGTECYADCDGDDALTLADFGCFQTKFALQDPYADCNQDGSLNLADFGCFQTKFALGCP